ncbi:MAG: hypothetical protein A4E65_00519 [Syntrophorhabdus sp. PtaU1.Bin153]|nr:MAG: hypothetical protein A4E65_00519 [Syntrophorhabdus sp. PtaU1.Bin153]
MLLERELLSGEGGKIPAGKIFHLTCRDNNSISKDWLLFNSSEPFRSLLLAFDVSFPENGHTVRLRGTTAVDV